MIGKFLSILNLKPDESKMAFSLWILIAVNTFVLELADVVATTGFISNLGVDNIPWLWIVTTLLTMFAAGGYLVVIDRYSRLKLVTWLLLGLAFLYMLLELMFMLDMPEWLTYPALYLLADQQFMIMPLAFWTLASDVYAVTESKRVFPFIASGAVIGGLAGNAAAASFASLAEAYSLGLNQIFIGIAVILVLSAGYLQLAFRKAPLRTRQSREEHSSLRETVNVGLDYFLNIPSFKAVGILMLLTGLMLTINEFNFLAVINNNVTSDAEFQRFLGYYKAVQTTGLLIVQWAITSRVLTKINLKYSFLVLPAAMSIAGGLAMAIPALIGAASSRFIARTVYTAWDEPARKSLQGLVPDEKRGRISAFMDSYFITSATVVGCIVLIILQALSSAGIITAELSVMIYLGIATLAGVAAVFVGVYLARVYDTSMLNFRLARSKRKSVLDGLEF